MKKLFNLIKKLFKIKSDFDKYWGIIENAITEILIIANFAGYKHSDESIVLKDVAHLIDKNHAYYVKQITDSISPKLKLKEDDSELTIKNFVRSNRETIRKIYEEIQ